MNSFIDHLPSRERERIRKRLRSPEEYERLREKVKGPEDLEREMEKNAEFAEARLHLESVPGAQDSAREFIGKMAREGGIESVLEQSSDIAIRALKEGNFEVIISESEHVPCLAVRLKTGATEDVSSSKVQEVLALSPALQKQVLAHLKKAV